jgi:hypothetical protein
MMRKPLHYRAESAVNLLKSKIAKAGGESMDGFQDILQPISHAPISKSAITNRSVLNEAFHYPKPV